MILSWEFPYTSRRVPVFARNVVATSQPLAAQAGLDMLKGGGNAVDAALATAIALTVVEPTGNGIGSDAFAMVWDGRVVHGINGSGRSPRAWSDKRYADIEELTIGWDSVTVPGAVDAWVTLSRRFGRLPFARLFEPAVRYAEQGYAVSPTIQGLWTDSVQTYADQPDFAATFLCGDHAPYVGEFVRFPDHAATLIKIAETEGEAFYRGELAERIVDQARAANAGLDLNDLVSHRSEWVDPLALDYGDVRVHEMPPNSQGIASLIALGILRHRDPARYPVDSADSVHLQVEAMKIAIEETRRIVADPDHMQVDAADLLDEQYLRRHAERINMDRARQPHSSTPTDGGTVYLAAADANGMMVSFIQSNFWGFGSGVVIPGTGISLQNRGAGFVLDPAHPNCFGGAKRPYHTIMPGFVTCDGTALMAFGVMGGHMQSQGHVQMVTRIFDYGQNPQAAADAPRWFVDPDFALVLESGFADPVRDELERRGQRFSERPPMFAFGGAQLIYRLDNGAYCAASDHRKDGQAVGF